MHEILNGNTKCFCIGELFIDSKTAFPGLDF